MRLEITHDRRGSDNPSLLSHCGTYYLREPGLEPIAGPQIEQRLADQTLKALAARWYLLNGPANVPDANEELLRGISAADAPISMLLRRNGHAFEFVSDDPILVAAVDERVRRAIAMIVEDKVYARYLSDMPEQGYDLNSEDHGPCSSALPPVPKEIRDKVIKAL